ncbi:ATP-binding protein [Paenibacillus chitinolyticus]|uniref:ATP-binding protein n=1 Tax=Paenibacillus chitinolyticus TaxID=79263 RepID=UPI0036705981
MTIPDQESSRNRSTGGSGLGLTISQKIVRRHGGDLAVSNHPEGGALLEGWLPAGGPD